MSATRGLIKYPIYEFKEVYVGVSTDNDPNRAGYKSIKDSHAEAFRAIKKKNPDWKVNDFNWTTTSGAREYNFTLIRKRKNNRAT